MISERVAALAHAVALFALHVDQRRIKILTSDLVTSLVFHDAQITTRFDCLCAS